MAAKSSSTRVITDVLQNVVKTSHITGAIDSWQRLLMATAVPLLGYAIWYLSRTVIEVSDDEQAMWVLMWLSQQSTAVRRVRRFTLMSLSP